MYKAIAPHWPGIVRDYAERDVRIAPHVVSEFDRYLRCGILQHGYAFSPIFPTSILMKFIQNDKFLMSLPRLTQNELAVCWIIPV